MTDALLVALVQSLRLIADAIEGTRSISPGDELPWDRLPLDVRTYNAIKNGIEQSVCPLPVQTIGDLRKVADGHLLKQRNLGRVTVRRLRKILAEYP